MSYSIDFLLSSAAKAGRVTRQAGYPAIGEVRPTHVVHVETSSNVFVELDADSEAHAVILIDSWIGTMGNMTARYHRVAADGSLVEGSRIYDFRDYAECA